MACLEKFGEVMVVGLFSANNHLKKMCDEAFKACEYVCKTYFDITATSFPSCSKVRVYIDNGRDAIRWEQLPRAVYEVLVSLFSIV